jgi:hypothetical protein
MPTTKIDRARELASSVTTLNRVIRELQSEYRSAPTFSLTKRVKVQIAEEIVRHEARKADYVRQLNKLNSSRPAKKKPSMPVPGQKEPQRSTSSRGWEKVRLQHQINEMYKEIGVMGKRIAEMGYTAERKELVLKHKELIRQRRQLIWQVNLSQ